MTIWKKIKETDLFQLALLLQGIASFLALSIYAYLGSFSRLMADDYYHSYLLQSGKNLWQISVEKYLHVSNRYSTMSFFSFGEEVGIRWVSGLMIFLWLLGLIWFLTELKEIKSVEFSRKMIFSLASLLIFLSILQAPNRFQTLYWLSGSQTYFAPLVFLVYFFAALLFFIRCPHSKGTLTFLALFVATLAFLIGGLSETVGTLHIGILSIAILAFWIWGKKTDRKRALILLGAALLGALISRGVMALSPANDIRSSAPPLPIPVFLERSVIFPYGFITDTFKSLLLPSAFTVIIGFLVFSPMKGEIKKQGMWLSLIIVPIITFALISASFAPSAYALSYPDARVRFPARVVLTFGLFIEGALLGLFFGVKKKFLVALLLIGASLYPLRGAWQAYQSLPKFQAYANAWDTRDAYIQSKRDGGMMNISLPPMDGMAGIKEFDVDANHWVNRGAVDYYGVDAISVHSTSLDYDE